MGVRDREDNRDANPLVNALPAQVVGRRRRAQPSQAELQGDTVTLDRQLVFLMKPEHRAKWLSNALEQMGQDQEIRASDIYDIIASNRFVDGVQPKLGRKMASLLLGQLELFSAKQKRFLSSEAALVAKFGVTPQQHAQSQQAEQQAQAADDMMARCAAFVREKMIERGEIQGEQGKKESKEIKKSKESKDGKESRDARESKEAKESKDSKERKEPRDSRELKESKEARESKDAKEPKDAKESKDSKAESKSKKPRKRSSTSESSSSKVRQRKRGRSRSRKRSESSQSASSAKKKSKKKAASKKRRKSTSTSSSSSSASSSSDRSAAKRARKKRRG